MAKREDSEKIVINVGGIRNETYKSTLKSLPGTRLALLVESVSDDDNAEPGSVSEFFFDRDPGMFTYILNYYRTGNLNFPPKACGCLFEKELAFWGIKETDMEPCCWVSYSTHRDRIEALRKLGPSDPEQQDSRNLLLLSPERSQATCMSKTWALFDDPHSSMAAEIISVISLIFLLVAIIDTCADTHPFFEEYENHVHPTTDYILENDIVGSSPKHPLFVVEAVSKYSVTSDCSVAQGVETKPPSNIDLKEEMAKREDSEKIVINVGGIRNETYKSTLKSLPGTRLALLVESVSDDDNAEPGSVSEFFFDRDPGMFTYILNYYRTGNLSFPPKACGCLFEKELAFWGIKETDMEPCCWVSYSTHMDRIEALRKLGPSDPEQQDSRNLLLLSPERSQATCMSKTWALFDDPHSSMAAEIISVISLIFLLVAIINTCAGTHPFFEEYKIHVDPTTAYILENDIVRSSPKHPLFVVEAVCTVWFTVEFLVRVICCPDKLLFIKNPLNTVDFVAILPFYIEVRPEVLSYTTRNALGVVRVVRFLRLLRVFKLMPDVVCVQVLGHTLRASLGCYVILSASLAVTSFMFGSLIYYAEHFFRDHNVQHISFGAWWAVVTLTTIGYGDIYPVGWPGMIVGGLCAVTGVLFLALPVPVLVNNFRIYHKLVTAKRKLSLKKRYPDLSVPETTTSRNLDHECPLVTESIH